MTYEKVKFRVGEEVFDVIRCKGEGTCNCILCQEKNKWSVSWTSWCYKLSEDDDFVMCRNCLTETLVQRRIDKACKEAVTKFARSINRELWDILIDDDGKMYEYGDLTSKDVSRIAKEQFDVEV